MKKHINFFERVKLFMKGYKSYECAFYGASDDLKSHISMFKKAEKNSYVGSYIIYYDGKKFFDKEKCYVMDVKNNFIISEDYSSSNYEGKLSLTDFNGNAFRFKTVNSSVRYVFESTNDFLIFKDPDTGKDVIVDSNGKVLYKNIEKFIKINNARWDAITFKIDDQFYFACDGFEYVNSYDYITKFGENSLVYIGIRYDCELKKKKYYFLSKAKDLKSDFTYRHIEPAQKAYMKTNARSYVVSEKIVNKYICTLESGRKILLNDLGNELYPEVRFLDIEPFNYGCAFARTKDRGIVLLKEDGSYVETYIKKINFPFREVKYGLYYEIYAGVETFDEETYIDLKGDIHKIYNMNRYSAYCNNEE